MLNNLSRKAHASRLVVSVIHSQVCCAAVDAAQEEASV